MGLYRGPKIVKDGLIFGYDADDRSERFYKGEPTTNYIYHQNPRLDSSYVSADLSIYGGTIVAKHPGAIRVYNTINNELSAIYYNGGVSDPTNNQHAYWIYDEILKKPVVQMIDTNHSWMAKSFGLGMNAWATYGITTGSQYTISWMQWTSDISKGILAGVYSSNSSGSYNFWDGIPTSYNTLSSTWQKCSSTFTVSDSHNISVINESIYMYGMYGPYGTIRISDVQLEFKAHSTQFTNNSRTATDSLLDLTKNYTIDLTNTKFDSTAHPYFNGGTGEKIITNLTDQLTDFTACVWYKDLGSTGYGRLLDKQYSDGFTIMREGGNANRWGGSILNAGYPHGIYLTLPDGKWHYIVTMRSGSTHYLYGDGIENKVSETCSTTALSAYSLAIGSWSSTNGSTQSFIGYVPVVQVYNRALSEDEIQQNYDALKNRFI